MAKWVTCYRCKGAGEIVVGRIVKTCVVCLGHGIVKEEED